MPGEIPLRALGIGQDVIDPAPLIPHQPTLDQAVEIGPAAGLPEKQGFDIMHRRHKLGPLPGHAGVIGEMQQVMPTRDQGRRLLPEPAFEQRKPDQPIADVGAIGEPAGRIGHQDFVLIA